MLDIDKAIAIIRSTKNEEDVVPNLMKGFDLSEIQAEYVAEIKLRHLNREYLMNRIQELGNIQDEIADLELEEAEWRRDVCLACDEVARLSVDE